MPQRTYLGDEPIGRPASVAWVLVIPIAMAIFALSFFCLGAAWADNPAQKNHITATVVSVLDGDTVKADLHLLPGLTQRVNVRVVGVDTPESKWRAKCDDERERAAAAMAFTVGLIAAGDGQVVLTDISNGKFAGRVLADMLVGPDQISLRQALINNGHARPYDGGKREGWCG